MKALLFLFLFSSLSFAREPISGARYEALTGIQKNKEEKKEKKIQTVKKQDFEEKNPSSFLAENLHYLPAGSRVLDVDMEEGRNAVFLARKGFKVTAIEDNEEAFQKSKILAKEFGVRLEALFDKISSHSFSSSSFDVIICFKNADKKLIDKMKLWLRPGGYIVLSTRSEEGPSLLDLFKDMKILKYEAPENHKEYVASIILKKE